MNYDLKALDALLAERIRQKDLPGVSCAIYGPDGVIFEKGYGFGDMEHKRPIDENTVFGIASMSKSTSTLALAILEAEGRFSFEDPVVKYIPSFRIPGNPADTVLVKHLAMHTAGIPPMEPLEWSIAMNSVERFPNLPEENVGKKSYAAIDESDKWALEMRRTSPNQMDKIEQVIDYIANCSYKTIGAPGEYMSYSNEGYAVISYIVDAAAGMPLEQFLNERVFGPMGMTRTVLDLDGSEAKKIASDGNITSLFEEVDGRKVADDCWSILPPFRACACVKSTAHDMARYYSCIGNGGVIDGKQVIPARAAEIMVGAGFAEQEKPIYCFGLNKRTCHGHVICEHSGGLHGVSTHGGFLKGEGYGFAALCNQGDCDTEELCWIMSNMLMDRPLEESQRWLHPVGREFSEPQALTGTYICHEGIPSEMTVYVTDNGKLEANTQLGVMQLEYCGESWFQGFRNGETASRCRFLVRDGKAWGVMVYTRVWERKE